MSRSDWLQIDLDGLAKTLARNGKGFILRELVQNALDAPGTTRVDVTFKPVIGRPLVTIEVTDDSPEGFKRLDDAWTLFADSSKKHDPTLRGRFNVGEKQVLAFCENARIESTTGTVIFNDKGRRVYTAPMYVRAAGSKFSGELRMTRAEMQEMVAAAKAIIPPTHIIVTVNGDALTRRVPVTEFDALLETEVADDTGVLKRVWRETTLRLYDTDGQPAMLYELGLPVVETGDKWHCNVLQKVPLNIERDNVRPAYLQELRVAVLNATHELLVAADVTEPWVRDAMASDEALVDTIADVVTKRFGYKVVAYDPSDPEANKIATASGYAVVHGGTLSADEWENVKRANAILPAGQVTPSPKAFSPNGTPLKAVPRDEWPAAWHRFHDYVRRLGLALLGKPVSVTIANDTGWGHRAACGPDRVLFWNVATEGKAFFDHGPTERVNSLVLHEFAHAAGASDHLSSEFYDTCCKLGARLAAAAVRDPSLFTDYTPVEA
jgi:hypothetical protein